MTTEIRFSTINDELIINKETIDTLWEVALYEVKSLPALVHIHIEEEAEVITHKGVLGYMGATDSVDECGNKTTSARVAVVCGKTPLCITFIFSDHFAFIQVGDQFEQGELVEVVL